MKQYTTTEQTAKLIELGFREPFINEYLHIVEEYGYAVNKERNFTIGEPRALLPKADRAGERSMVYDGLEWVIDWDNDDGTINQVVATELIDALYDMILKLKEEGVI